MGTEGIPFLARYVKCLIGQYDGGDDLLDSLKDRARAKVLQDLATIFDELGHDWRTGLNALVGGEEQMLSSNGGAPSKNLDRPEHQVILKSFTLTRENGPTSGTDSGVISTNDSGPIGEASKNSHVPGFHPLNGDADPAVDR